MLEHTTATIKLHWYVSHCCLLPFVMYSTHSIHN